MSSCSSRRERIGASTIMTGLDQKLIRRCQRASLDAYADAYHAATPIGAGLAWIGDALAVWNPLDESPAYNCLMDVEISSDPVATWQVAHELASSGGGSRFGLMLTPDMRLTVTDDRLRALGLHRDE